MAKKRSAVIHASPFSGSPSGGHTATVARDSSGITTISLNFENLGRAHHTLAVDCAAAILRHGHPELHFGCLTRDDVKLTRLVVVRYERGRFVERVPQNDEFRARLELDLPRTTEPEFFSKLYEQAAPTKKVFTIDVEAEGMSYVGSSAALILVSASNFEVSLVAQGKRPTFDWRPDLELTMRTSVLADLLRSWRKLGDVMRAGE